MRILSISVRNYRVHRDFTTTLDPSRNLIGGGNESGKSTLAEAMHRALFLRAKTGGKIQQAMRSDIHPGHPEVTLVFEAAGAVWTVDKRFSGASGQIRLSCDGRPTLQGDEAETMLDQLIGSEPSRRANQLEGQWAHLWVWQGKSGDNAAAHASEHKDQLVLRLQQDGLAAVMESDTDQSVREIIQAIYDEIFTKTGSVKAGSKFDSARKLLVAAEQNLSAAEDHARRLEAAVSDQSTAARTLAETAVALPALQTQLVATEEALARASRLQASADAETLQHRAAVTAREQLVTVDRQIREFREQAAAAQKTLLPAEGKLAVLADQENAARDASQLAEADHRARAEEVRAARLQHDFAAARASHLEKSAICDTLAAKAADIANIREALAVQQEALGKLPALTPRDLTTLRKLDGQHREAESALTAIAAGVELVGSDQSVWLDGSLLESGKPHLISEVAELRIGTGTRLRIQPGGGLSLAETRQKAADLQQQLTHQLDKLTVETLDQAVEIVAGRQTLDQQIGMIDARLQALGANDIAATLATATAVRDAAAAEVSRRSVALPEGPAPAALDEAERREAAARHDAATRRAVLQQASEAHRAHRDATEAARQNLRDLEIGAAALETNHGDGPARERALKTALVAETAAKTSLDATLKLLAELNPGQLGADQQRLARAVTQQGEKHRDAEMRIAVARSTLALDGSQDPVADLANARARAAQAGEESSREERRAHAIALLHQLFSESQAAIGENLTRPIADKIGAYLECLFGPGVSVKMNFHGGESGGLLELARPGQPAFPFESLSGGAREQVAAAVRLAMAEILAANHDGCLPLVFDDAFSFSDPERVQALQRMLDLAACRGLQIIVLTCAPADYSSLGARGITLP